MARQEELRRLQPHHQALRVGPHQDGRREPLLLQFVYGDEPHELPLPVADVYQGLPSEEKERLEALLEVEEEPPWPLLRTAVAAEVREVHGPQPVLLRKVQELLRRRVDVDVRQAVVGVVERPKTAAYPVALPEPRRVAALVEEEVLEVYSDYRAQQRKVL